ncbi:MAG: hypothetical protein H7325_03825 [Pedobacter sp.]|nr:hypothetical protein [Pedobacter sp.]
MTHFGPLIPNFLSFILSFRSVCIYSNNHHHISYPVITVKGKILWAISICCPGCC